MMVKKIVMTGLCMLLGSTLNANDMLQNRTFVGVELESTKVESGSTIYLDDVLQADLTETSDSALEYGVNFGVNSDEWRTTLLYTYYNNDEAGLEETMNKGSFLLDYFLWTTQMGDSELSPYMGLHVGYMSYELTGDTGYGADQKIADDDGMFYGAQVGVSMIVSEIIGLDLSYKYSWTNLDDIPFDLTDGTNRLHMDNSLDNMGSIAFSIKYFY